MKRFLIVLGLVMMVMTARAEVVTNLVVTTNAVVTTNMVVVTNAPASIGVAKAPVMTTTKVSTTSTRFVVGAGVVMPQGGDVEKGKTGFGASLLIPIAGPLAVEAEALQFGDHLEAVDMTLLKVGGSLVLRLEKGGWWGYVKGGLDYNQIEFTTSLPGIDISVENAVGRHFGVGGGVNLTDRFGISVDYTKYSLDTTARVWGHGVSETVEGTYNHDLVKAGLTYRF